MQQCTWAWYGSLGTDLLKFYFMKERREEGRKQGNTEERKLGKKEMRKEIRSSLSAKERVFCLLCFCILLDTTVQVYSPVRTVAP